MRDLSLYGPLISHRGGFTLDLLTHSVVLTITMHFRQGFIPVLKELQKFHEKRDDK
jgi:hypothetical protein